MRDRKMEDAMLRLTPTNFHLYQPWAWDKLTLLTGRFT